MNKIIASDFKISGKGDRIQIKNPSPPFTTSTLQQEAARKLGFTIKRTMITRSMAQTTLQFNKIQ